jgi:hypothetical protein
MIGRERGEGGYVNILAFALNQWHTIHTVGAHQFSKVCNYPGRKFRDLQRMSRSMILSLSLSASSGLSRRLSKVGRQLTTQHLRSERDSGGGEKSISAPRRETMHGADVRIRIPHYR